MKNQIIIIAIIALVSTMAFGQEKDSLKKILLNIDLGLFVSEKALGRSISLGLAYKTNNNIFAIKNNFMNESKIQIFGEVSPLEKFNHISLFYGKSINIRHFNMYGLVGLGMLTGTKRTDFQTVTGEFFNKYIVYNTKNVKSITFPIEFGLNYHFKYISIGFNSFAYLSNKNHKIGSSLNIIFQ